MQYDWIEKIQEAMTELHGKIVTPRAVDIYFPIFEQMKREAPVPEDFYETTFVNVAERGKVLQKLQEALRIAEASGSATLVRLTNQMIADFR